MICPSSNQNKDQGYTRIVLGIYTVDAHHNQKTHSKDANEMYTVLVQKIFRGNK